MARRNGFALLVVLLVILAIVVILTIRATRPSLEAKCRQKHLEEARRIGREMVEYAKDDGDEFPELLDKTQKPASQSADRPTGYSGAMVDAHEKSKRLKCRNNLRQIGMALFMYRQVTDGQWPKDLEMLVDKKYLTNRKVLRCPSARSPAGSVDYVLVKTEGRGFDAADVIVYDRKENHKGGRNVLQFDQQVLWLSEEDFKKRMGNTPYE